MPPLIQLQNSNTAIGFIYTYRNVINGKIYVGRTIDPTRRHNQYLRETHKPRAINRAMKKYGETNFSYQVIDHADTEEGLNFLERHYIEIFKSRIHQHGYNMTIGGDGMSGYKHSSESRHRMSMVHSNRPRTEKEMKVLTAHFNWKGRTRGPQSKEHKDLVVKNRIGIPLSKEHKDKLTRIVSCPNCLKQGGITIMKRWHFDKCRVGNNASTDIS